MNKEREAHKAQRQQAKDNNEKVYVGKSCVNGHEGLRSTRTNICLQCQRKTQKKCRDNNKAYYKEYREKNKESMALAQKKHRAKHLEEYEAYQKEYHATLRLEHPERLRKYRATGAANATRKLNNDN